MKAAIASIALLLALTGCGTPDCGSDLVLETVSELGHELLADCYRNHGHDVSDAEVAEQVALKPNYVRKTDYDKQTDTYSCDATLIGKSFDPEGQAVSEDYEWRITFNVSPDAAGDYGDYIVEVQGGECPALGESPADVWLDILESILQE